MFLTSFVYTTEILWKVPILDQIWFQFWDHFSSSFGIRFEKNINYFCSLFVPVLFFVAQLVLQHCNKHI